MTEKKGEKGMICKQCGAKIEDEQAMFCTSCGASLAAMKDDVNIEKEKTEGVHVTSQGIGESSNRSNANYSSSSQNSYILSQSSSRKFKLSEGEVMVKRYHCSSCYGPRSDGYLTVTNKRIIFHGVGIDNFISQEVALDSVSGISSYYGSNFNKLAIIIAVIGILLGIYLLTKQSFSGLVVLIIGCIAAANIMRKSFLLMVYSSKANGSPIAVGEGPKTLMGNESLISLSAAPTRETDAMLAELGAMVLDLQQLGDLAIDKWKK